MSQICTLQSVLAFRQEVSVALLGDLFLFDILYRYGSNAYISRLVCLGGAGQLVYPHSIPPMLGHC